VDETEQELEQKGEQETSGPCFAFDFVGVGSVEFALQPHIQLVCVEETARKDCSVCSE